MAGELARFFTRVQATDISLEQLRNALQKENISYSLQPAEKTNFPDDSFDLITVGQAVHWFNFDAFYKEVNRVLKPGGIIAIIGYALFSSNPETDAVINKFYQQTIGPYWDEERKYLEQEYKTIPFPFEEIPTPLFQQEYKWSFEQLTGYLKTWSAVKHFESENSFNPVDEIIPDLKISFGAKNKVIFPVLFRLGRK